MRKKWILSIFILLLALPFFVSNVVAETAEELEDGTYEKINYEVLHEIENEKSRASGYFSETATLIVENGKQTIQLEISSFIKSLKVNGIEVNNISENEAENTRRVEFVVDGDLAEVLKMEMHVLIPEVHEDNYNTRALFDIRLPTKAVDVEESTEPEKKPTEPEEPIKTEDPTEPTEPEQPVVDNGDEIDNRNPALVPDEAYKINFVSESNAVNRQFDNPAALLFKNGEKYIQITGTGGQAIESLTINGTEVTWSEINADGTFTIQFKLEGSLSKILDFGMVINAGSYGIMEHTVDLTFDEITQNAADIADYTLLEVTNDSEDVEVPSEGNDPITEENPKEDPKENPVKEEPSDKTKTETPAKNDPLTPEKAYEIGFVIKHETDDKPSSANSFFKGPAILLEKDGERYIQITVTGKEYIDWLKNKFGEMVVVKEDENSIVYQFKLDSALSEVIWLEMQITVPGFYDGTVHKARLFLDESSLKEVNADNYRLVASNNENGPKVPGEPVKNDPVEDTDETGIVPPTKTDNKNSTNEKQKHGSNKKNDPTIEKPKLGSNETNESTNETKVTGQEKNPQTGDTTNILLYIVMLIGSAIPLAIMAKRRYANVA